MVTESLDTIDHHSIRLSSKLLRATVGAPPLMSYEEFVEFHRRLEAHSRRKLKDLFCSFCSNFIKSTPSKTTFTDAQAAPNYRGRRACINCSIVNGHFDRRDVVIKKKKFFVCAGCKNILPHANEQTTVMDVLLTAPFPYRDEGWGQGAEITISSGGKRWCKGCRMAIASLEDSGAVRATRVYLG